LKAGNSIQQNKVSSKNTLYKSNRDAHPLAQGSHCPLEALREGDWSLPLPLCAHHRLPHGQGHPIRIEGKQEERGANIIGAPLTVQKH